jgi:hypothetical protein
MIIPYLAEDAGEEVFKMEEASCIIEYQIHKFIDLYFSESL